MDEEEEAEGPGLQTLRTEPGLRRLRGGARAQDTEAVHLLLLSPAGRLAQMMLKTPRTLACRDMP